MSFSKTKKILSNFGVYKKKLLFFAFLILVSGYFYTKNVDKYSADETGSYVINTEQELVINVEVSANGEITIDGTPSKYKINFLDNSDEVRFAVIDSLGRYVSHAIVNLTLPKDVANETTHQVLAVHGVGNATSEIKDSRTILYEADDLSPSAIISIIANMPKGTINKTLANKISVDLSEVTVNTWLMIAVILPLITMIYLCLFLLYQYRTHKIDTPEIEVNAPPMAIPPAIVGALYHQKVGSREVAATLIDLAQRGDIIILDKDRSFAFGKGRFDQRLLGFEKILLSKIFKNNLTSDLAEFHQRVNDHFYSKKISIVTAGIYALSTRLGYFKINPRKVHTKYRAIGMFSFLIGLSCFILNLTVFKDPQYAVFFWVGMMAASLVIFFTASAIPIRTSIGQEVLSNWLAFRKFLMNTDPYPYVENHQEIFQKYLPYAIVLGCEANWARRFSEHNFTIPDWYLSEKEAMGMEDFCLSLFPIISYVGRSLAALKEPGFE